MLIVAHFSALKSTWKLKHWAEADSVSNEPLLPLLRRIGMILLCTIPLTALLFWSEFAFCARLNDKKAASLYLCYAPLILIQVTFVGRYFLCRARSHWPGFSWLLVLCFTILLAYQTNRRWKEHYILRTADHKTKEFEFIRYSLAWWIVLAPLFAFDLIMIGCLGVILHHVIRGYYRLVSWQILSIGLYLAGIGCTMFGQFMLWEKIEYYQETFTFPSVVIFTGLLCVSVAVYIVSRHYVNRLMLTRGGAIPVPLRQTDAGWEPANLGRDRWLLLGEIELTSKGRARQILRRRALSDLETDRAGHGFNMCCCLGSNSPSDIYSGGNRERRLQYTLRRTTSGSYDEIEPCNDP